LIVTLKELLRLGLERLKRGESVFGEPLGLVGAAVGAHELRLEHEVRVRVGPQPIPVSPAERLVCTADDLHVLLRHRPRSISPGGVGSDRELQGLP